MEIDIETAVCFCQHIKAYFKQCAEEEVADVGEPCANCQYVKTCGFDWLTHMKPLFEKTGISMGLGRRMQRKRQLYNNNQGRKEIAIENSNRKEVVQMRDIMEMSYEAYRAMKGNTAKQQEMFAEMLFAELSKEKGEDIIPYLSCTYDIMHREYKIILSLPDSFCHITNSANSNRESEIATDRKELEKTLLEQPREYPAEPKIKPSSDKKIGTTVQINIDDTAIDTLIEKAERLMECLQEANQIIESLTNYRITSEKRLSSKGFSLAEQAFLFAALGIKNERK